MFYSGLMNNRFGTRDFAGALTVLEKGRNDFANPSWRSYGVACYGSAGTPTL